MMKLITECTLAGNCFDKELHKNELYAAKATNAQFSTITGEMKV